MKKRNFANHNIQGLPNSKTQSTGGVGMFCPMEWRTIDGVTAPFGNIQRIGANQGLTALQYNEYIVYDPAQVKIKYLFKMKFNYR